MVKTSESTSKSNLIHEVFFLRFVACISVVFIHSISISFNLFSFDQDELWNLKKMQMVFMFATPAFIWISQMVLGFSYRNRSPKNFWSNRLKYLLVPYFFAGFLTAILPYVRDNPEFHFMPFFERLMRIYFLGEWVGYFVIIIFQFYLIYFFFKKYLDRWPVHLVIIVSFLLNFIYLLHIQLGAYIPQLQAISFYKYSHLPFIGWIFYFAVGYYCGKHVQSFIKKLHLYRFWIFGGALLSLLLILILTNQQIISSASSKRLDILPYTILIVFTLYYLANKMKKIPAFVYLISQASYGIYLIHSLFQSYVLHWLFLSKYDLTPGVYISIQFILGVIGSFCIVFILNQWKYGAYLVGKAKFFSSKQPSSDRAISLQK